MVDLVKQILLSDSLKRELHSIGGYDLSQTGKIMHAAY